MSHFTLYVKVLWFFLFTGYPLLCVCEMTKLVFVNAPSFLNMKNDKLNYKYSSRQGKSSHKTSMVWNDGSFESVVNSCLVLSYLHIISLEFRGSQVLLVGLRVSRALWLERKKIKQTIYFCDKNNWLYSSGIRKVTLLVWTTYRSWLREGEGILK